MDLIEQIKHVEFHSIGDEQIDDLEKVLDIIAVAVDADDFLLLKQDFKNFADYGKFVIFNNFSGGIIFLREPELIESAAIELSTKSSVLTATVTYASANRNARNIKYKPDAGKVESLEWNTINVFPNFGAHKKPIKLLLVLIIGKIVKAICEEGNLNSWCMKYTKDFNLCLLLDGELIQKLVILHTMQD